ncbi:MAG TPA: sugar transferase [Acidisarcina sp.]|nr:sugar transferase [Acidisarcina sp.]
MATSEFLQRLTVKAPETNDSQNRSRAVAAAARSTRASMVLWVLTDVVTVLFALMVSIEVTFGGLGQGLHAVHSSASNLPSFHHPLTLLLGYLIWFIAAIVLVSRRYHLYEPLRISSTFHEQRMTMQACFTAGLLLTGSLYLVHGEVISRTLVLLMIMLTTAALCVRRLGWRAILYRRFERGLETRNILIIGTGRIGQALRHHIDSVRHLGYTFKGYIHVPGVDLDIPSMSGEVLGGVDHVFDLAREHFVDEIFVASPCERGLVKHIVAQARNAGVDIRVVPDLYDGLAWNSEVEYVGQFPTIPLHRGEAHEIGYFLKRMLDVVLSSATMLAISPLLTAIAIGVKLDSPGPIFYRSERIGKKGRVFKCVKFRTMVRDAERRRADILHMNERDGVLFKITNDPRITRLGRLLRKYSLDELPQFYNVLRGDMSIVGPRPPLASEVKQYELSHLRRLDVTPGITGLWQVQARQDPSFDSYISLDTAYIENWTLWLDIKILIRTVAVVVHGTGS